MLTKQTNIFDYDPGYQNQDTSRESAKVIKLYAKTLRQECLEVLATGSDTADGVAETLGKTPFSVRPRIAELFKLGLIKDTGARRVNASGHTAIIWGAA